MESTSDQNRTPKVGKIPVSLNVTISPVSNLALNLSSLSTSVAGSPNRRISWSNPFPGGEKIGIDLDDLTPSMTESPTFIDILSHKKASKRKNAVSVQNTLLSHNVEAVSHIDKENRDPQIKNVSESLIIKSSQDSGYSSSSTSYSWREKLNFCSFDLDEEGDDSIFNLNNIEDSPEPSSLPSNMTNLLSKPLNVNKPVRSTPGIKNAKSIRRCLSIEMDSVIDQSLFECGKILEKSFCSGAALAKSSKSAKLMRRSMSMEIDSAMDQSVYECENQSKSGFCSVTTSIGSHNNDLTLNSKCAFKRLDPPNDFDSKEHKRRKSSPCVELPPNFPSSERKFKRSYSETAATVMHAILKSDLQPELIGDNSRSYALPLVKGKHDDLKSISPDTLAHLMQGEYKEKVQTYTIVDCRYPYEFEGGHIQGAKNIYTKEDILDNFFTYQRVSTKNTIVIFHCEFSSERAPKLCRFLRKKDREFNQGNYPRLQYPEMYILEGGYKAFFQEYKELCEPQTYKPMTHKDHEFDFRHFRAKSKSWGADSKNRVLLRLNSKITNI
ncbi:m-phase inducer phosphatase [Trichonephila clavata]|uniref:M-phase inducer phosphatase n=1 Tax=Trichonephila clavata TaxID=2740835 RepID=A0A8X6JFU4_TRICU|nr:m-phase inducer phosphatase [Trichonephila clavata]